jgi:hypothetical protein
VDIGSANFSEVQGFDYRDFEVADAKIFEGVDVSDVSKAEIRDCE